jgi:two-component system, OmpR family, response regulator
VNVREIETVLLVDDDAKIRLIIEMAIEGLTDWKVISAESGEDALLRMKEARPDLILLDIMMPGIDGTMVFEEIKNRFASLVPPVIFLTAKVQSHEVYKFQSLGAAGVIVKPFDPMTLVDQIKTILGLS